MKSAFTLYTRNAQTLTADEFSRLCLSLSTVERKQKNFVDAKRYLELVAGKVTDKKMMLEFYQESAKMLACE